MPEQQPNQPPADRSGRSDGSKRPRRLRPSGGYRKLRSYQVATISLIHQTNYLLDQQISALERDFVQEGGYSEQLAAARIAERQKQRQGPAANTPAAPACPRCGKPMALRTARKGARAGSQFWGCSGFPECKGTRALEASDGSDRSKRGSV